MVKWTEGKRWNLNSYNMQASCDNACDSSHVWVHDKNTSCNTKYTHSSSELWALCTILKFKFQTATIHHILVCHHVHCIHFCLGLKIDYQLVSTENQTEH